MRWRIVLLVGAGLAVLAGAGLLVLRLEREAPTLSFAVEPRFIGASTTVGFAADDRKSGLRRVWVRLRQGQTDRELLGRDFPGGMLTGGSERRQQFELPLDVKALGLEQGPATLTVAASDRSWWGFGRGNISLRELPVTVDTVPPRLDILSTAHNVKPGGTGLAAYRVSEEVARTGVEVGDQFFPGFPEAGGGPRAYAGFFAMPYENAEGARVALTATDPAGNTVRRAFPVRVLARKIPRDTIEISDSFLAAKMPEFAAADPRLDPDPVKGFLAVNNEWRRRDHQRIREICARSSPERLWKGAFVQMRNTANKANYAEYRSYRHRGKVIDQQVHLGLDLASTAGAPVPAANSGLVAFAGDLGIYGQAVILDHGQGLFSLYGHLSGIAVAAGQKLEQGQTLGSTGQTGMAGGDHLHFSTLLDGVFVSPLEWYDQHWIDDNISNKLSLFGSVPLS